MTKVAGRANFDWIVIRTDDKIDCIVMFVLPILILLVPNLGSSFHTFSNQIFDRNEAGSQLPMTFSYAATSLF